jgi:hypothetical protein
MPVPKGSGKYARPMFGQAAHIIRKFGGEARLATLLTQAGWPTNRVTLYRWNYSAPAGTNGLVPTHQRARIVQIARMDGVLLTDQDWDQRRIHYKPTESDHIDVGVGVNTSNEVNP